MSEEKEFYIKKEDNNLKIYYKHPVHDQCCFDWKEDLIHQDICDYSAFKEFILQLQTAKEENETLAQQNKQMREALEYLVNSLLKDGYSGKYIAKAQQALNKGVE